MARLKRGARGPCPSKFDEKRSAIATTLQRHPSQAKPSSPQPDQEIQRPKHCRKMVFQVLQLEPAKRPIKKPEKQQ
jgi:hypothetical protein